MNDFLNFLLSWHNVADGYSEAVFTGVAVTDLVASLIDSRSPAFRRQITPNQYVTPQESKEQTRLSYYRGDA